VSRWGTQKHWTAARQLQAIHAFYTRTGHWPLTQDFHATSTLPDPVTVQRTFGTLAEARRQAGAKDGGHEGHGGGGRGGGRMHWGFRSIRQQSSSTY
jgi:hypothetical protein